MPHYSSCIFAVLKPSALETFSYQAIGGLRLNSVFKISPAVIARGGLHAALSTVIIRETLDSQCFCVLLVLLSDGPELICESNQTAIEHVPFTLNCTLVGYPKPQLTIWKDGIEVFLPEKLRREHEGSYVISISNGRQTVKSQINISVICKLFF